MDSDYELIIARTASLAIGNLAGISSVLSNTRDHHSDATDAHDSLPDAGILQFDPEPVLVDGWLTARDVS